MQCYMQCILSPLARFLVVGATYHQTTPQGALAGKSDAFLSLHGQDRGLARLAAGGVAGPNPKPATRGAGGRRQDGGVAAAVVIPVIPRW